MTRIYSKRESYLSAGTNMAPQLKKPHQYVHSPRRAKGLFLLEAHSFHVPQELLLPLGSCTAECQNAERHYVWFTPVFRCHDPQWVLRSRIHLKQYIVWTRILWIFEWYVHQRKEKIYFRFEHEKEETCYWRQPENWETNPGAAPESPETLSLHQLIEEVCVWFDTVDPQQIQKELKKDFEKP